MKKFTVYQNVISQEEDQQRNIYLYAMKIETRKNIIKINY